MKSNIQYSKKYKEQRSFKYLSKWMPAIGQSIVLLGVFTAPAQAFKLIPIGSYASGIFDEAAAEISAYDPVSQSLFITNGSTNEIDIIRISDPTNPVKSNSIALGNLGRLNSVAFKNGILAAAVENVNPQANGSVLFFNNQGNLLARTTVGASPDMVTFTPNGRYVLSANEAEPNELYTVDPEGSVSIIDTTNFSVNTVGFNGVPLVNSPRIFGPNASVAQDLEPEYITVSSDSTRAWITLQENNAIAILNLTTGSFENVAGLGYKDYSQSGNALDASDRDGIINIQSYDNLYGMYQPDGIAAYIANGETYLITANEGDARTYPTQDLPDQGLEEGDIFNEEERVNDLTLDPTAFPNAENLQADENLGRLNVTNTLGDTDGDGDFDELYTFGGRSFSIWDAQGNLVFDSGDLLEQLTADLLPVYFNSDSTNEDLFDNRSDNKGPEPEGLAIGTFGRQTLAFIGLERIGGIATFDISNPLEPVFVDYVNNRDFSVASELAGDLGPEGLLFINSEDSPIGKSLLIVTNEISGTTTIYTVPEPSIILGALTSAAFLLGNKRSKKARK